MKLIVLGLLVCFHISIYGQSVYNFQLETPEGKITRYSDIKGSKLSVIDFWATWCKPCINSIPKLVELSNKYSSDEVAFIAISIDGPRNLSKVRPYANSVGITYPVLLDTNQELMKELNVTVIPTLIIVNEEDEIIVFHEGFAPGDEKQLKEEIDGHLKK